MDENPTVSTVFEIEPPDPPNDGIMFVDHARSGRSGHLGHALVEYAPGKILAFYSNCSDRNDGHTGDGWMEYRRSEDGGRTWSAGEVLAYSKAVYDRNAGKSVMCENAVRADDGAVVLFNLECGNTAEEKWAWAPLDVPTCLRSTDDGRTWGPAEPMGDQPGRIWDAMVHDGSILVLELCNDSSIQWYGNLPEHFYGLYASTDHGRSFALRSKLPLEIQCRGYGALSILQDGGLIAYVYNMADEKHLDYVISHDGGYTWSDVQTAFFEKQIRNPQMARFKGGYVLHGRSGAQGEGSGHFVLYTSDDGIHWDSGRYLRMQEARAGAYSNNLRVHSPDAPERLLIQASHAYEGYMTNILHWWLT